MTESPMCSTYFEEECFGQPDKYRENLMQMRRDASRRLPQAQYREKQGLDFPHLRSYWEFAPVSQVTDQNSVSGYEPDILEAKHLLLTESFLYLYLNFSRVMKYSSGTGFFKYTDGLQMNCCRFCILILIWKKMERMIRQS